MVRYFYPGCILVEVEAIRMRSWLRDNSPTRTTLPDDVLFALSVVSWLLRMAGRLEVE